MVGECGSEGTGKGLLPGKPSQAQAKARRRSAGHKGAGRKMKLHMYFKDTDWVQATSADLSGNSRNLRPEGPKLFAGPVKV